ncbi:hypothetical protein [Streptomyces achromogenes]|uniref:hypothetical protein n=1 Tax=Streptomyces achromogenes TaxID=67255 RepID=UPI0036AC78FC
MGGAVYGLATRKRREFMREWVTPLHEALAVPLGMSELTDPRRYLHVPRNFSDDDAEIRIDVPTHMRFNEDLIADLIKKKLARENGSFTWRRAGRDTHVIVKKRQAPPKMLRLSDPGVREVLAKMPESAPLIGFGAGKKKVSVDLDHDSPHVLISASTGGGSRPSCAPSAASSSTTVRTPTSWTSSGSPAPGPAVCPASPTAGTSPRSTTP